MYNVYSDIFDMYKEYINENSKYEPKVVKNNNNTSSYFPTITFIQSNNTSLDNNSLHDIDYYEAFYFTVNIYTKNKNVDGTEVASQRISEELERLTSEFFRKINIKKTLDRPTPNLDTSILRRTMQFQCQVGNRGNIIRR